MTERERREQGLPPSPAQLALYEHFQREADEHKRRAEEMLEAVMGPATRSMAAIAESMQPALRMMQTIAEPLAHFQEHIAAVSTYYKDLDESMRVISEAMTMPTILPETFRTQEPIRYVPERKQRPVSVQVELTETHVEMMADKFATKLVERGMVITMHATSAQIDLFYNPTTQQFTRPVHTIERSMRFDGGEDNKRRDLFEKLRKTRGYVETSELKRILNCRTNDAVYKIVQGLNNQAADKLGLTMKLVEGLQGRGYRVNSQIAIHEVA